MGKIINSRVKGGVTIEDGTKIVNSLIRGSVITGINHLI